jgi:hypothetical protein|nr:MoaF N-terminal domain-containing protein [Kofleriaceae bacterium]
MTNENSIRGQKIQWTFDDGEMKGKTFEHTFATDGTVSFRCTTDDKMTGKAHYELSRLNDDVFAVSYLVPGGATLTSVLDMKTHKLVSFSSMKDQLAQHHGTFTEARAR